MFGRIKDDIGVLWAHVDSNEREICDLWKRMDAIDEAKADRTSPSRLDRMQLMKRWGIDSNLDFDLLLLHFPLSAAGGPRSSDLSNVVASLWSASMASYLGTSWGSNERKYELWKVKAYEAYHAFQGSKMWDMVAEAHALEESNGA